MKVQVAHRLQGGDAIDQNQGQRLFGREVGVGEPGGGVGVALDRQEELPRLKVDFEALDGDVVVRVVRPEKPVGDCEVELGGNTRRQGLLESHQQVVPAGGDRKVV